MLQRRSIHPSLTWYEADAGPVAERPALAGRIKADVAVVGGGLAGLTTCLELARGGQSVVLLEAGLLGAGASGRNAGFVSSGFALGFDRICERTGFDEALALHRLSQNGVSYVRSELAAGDPAVVLGQGALSLLRHRDDGSFQAHADFMNRKAGESLFYLDAKALADHVVSRRYHAGIFSTDAFHIQPLRYLRMIATKAEKAGARLFELSKVLAVESAGASWLVLTQSGSVACRSVVYCVSALDRRLHRQTGRAVLPVSTYIAVTPPLQQDILKTSAALADTRRAGDYYRLVDSGRLQWGGRITTRVSAPLRLAEMLRRDMVSVFPSLGADNGPAIDYAWRGIMGYTLHKMPLIGHDGQGQWFATGFGGHGLNTTAMAGQLIANAISKGDDLFRRFKAFGPDWAYGLLGRAGVQGAYWYMQLRDRIDELRSPSGVA